MEKTYIVTIDPAYAELKTFEEVYGAKEVVRCKECSHLKELPRKKGEPLARCDYGIEHWGAISDGFCAWGERGE